MISIDTIATIAALLLAIFAVIYSSGRRAAATDKSLEAIKKTTENLLQTLSQTPTILQGIQKNTDKLPDIAVHTKAVFEKSMIGPILSEMSKPKKNPHNPSVFIRLLPEEIINDVDTLIKENLDKSDDDLAAILVRELDFSLLLKTSEERKVSIDKCLINLGSYAKNRKETLSKSK